MDKEEISYIDKCLLAYAKKVINLGMIKTMFAKMNIEMIIIYDYIEDCLDGKYLNLIDKLKEEV